MIMRMINNIVTIRREEGEEFCLIYINVDPLSPGCDLLVLSCIRVLH